MAGRSIPPHVHLEVGESLHRVAENEYVVTDGNKLIPLFKKGTKWEALPHTPLSGQMRKRMGLRELVAKPAKAPKPKRRKKKAAAGAPAAPKAPRAPRTTKGKGKARKPRAKKAAPAAAAPAAPGGTTLNLFE